MKGLLFVDFSYYSAGLKGHGYVSLIDHTSPLACFLSGQLP